MRRRFGLWSVLTAGVAAACSSSLDGSSLAGGRTNSSGSPGMGSSSGGTTALVVSPSDAGVPAEQEDTLSFRAPVVSGRWVWTANPDTGKIAVVDAKTFTVRLADAGLGPTFLTALPTAPSTSKALVINVGSRDATLLSAAASGAVTSSAAIPLAPDANAWAVSKTGKFAIAWTDSHALTPDPAQGFQAITVVDLRGSTPRPTPLGVGFLPSRVFFNDAETRAFVVASSGISVIDLGAIGPKVLREQAVSRDPARDDATTRDVSILPDGSFALVRHEGSSRIVLVNLADGVTDALSEVTLAGPATDLDLTPTSALAVVRGDPMPQVSAPDAGNSDPDASASDPDASTGEAGAGSGGAAAGSGGAPSQPASLRSTLAILPIPGIFSAPTTFDTVSSDEVFGSVSIAPQGTQALLYTNATPNSHITIVQTTSGPNYQSRVVDVHGFVHDVFPSPDGAYAIASLSPTSLAQKSGFAVIPVSAELPSRVQTTDAPVFAVALSSGALPRAVITVSDGKAKFEAYIVRMPELVIDQIQLPSKPLPGATGLVPDAGVAYIAETHPEGRITFINLETGLARTITGFEISAKVVNGN